MTTAIAVRGDTPQSIIERDVEAANELARVVRDQKLSTVIQGKEYLKAEAWSMVDRVLGITMHVHDPKPFVDEMNQSGYIARADVTNSDGRVLATATAICTRSERRWSNADPFAVFSMAQTRAAGKAHRLALSAIAVLAGFEPITEDEVDEPKRVDLADLEHDAAPGKAPARQKASGVSVQAVRDACRGLTTPQAMSVLVALHPGAKSPKDLFEDEVDAMLGRVQAYRDDLAAAEPVDVEAVEVDA